jgi:RimJ/RimL family protein N-acetyltransferase/SAM-dependent methyltransferase
MSSVVLTPLEEEHLPKVLAWINTPFVSEAVGTVRPVSMYEHRRWYERLQQDPTRLVLVIGDVESGSQPVGLVGLSNIDHVYRNAELWIYLGERTRLRRGFGRAAVYEMLDIAFGRLGLHRVYIHVFEYNDTAQGFFAACGFHPEGRLRQAAFKRGRFWDKLVMSLLAAEFESVRGSADRARVHAANVRFHSVLAETGGYEQQPFLGERNRERVGALMGSLRARAPGGRLLDIGCGSGFIIGLAREHYDAIEGVDITPAMLERVPAHPKVHVQLAAIEELPFPDHSFDTVTAYGVLHHLHALGPALAQVRRVLEPGGLFYADESPNYYCLQALRGILAGGAVSPAVRRQAEAVQTDAEAYRERFGIDPAVTADAMYQDKRRGGLREEDLLAALAEAGFADVRFDYRWYLGEGQDTPEQAARREAFLRALLPLSRSLFKYVQIVAATPA